MENLLKQIANNTEPKRSFSIVVGDNKTRFKTWFKPPIQLDKKKDNEIALINLETYYSFPKIEWGFLPVLAGLIPFLTGTVLPALGVGALSGLASTGVQKLIGNGLYQKKGSGVCRIETDGEGLYLGQASGKGFKTVGNGLYLMK